MHTKKYMSRTLVRLNGAYTTHAGFGMLHGSDGKMVHVLFNWANNKVSFVEPTGHTSIKYNNHTVNV